MSVGHSIDCEALLRLGFVCRVLSIGKLGSLRSGGWDRVSSEITTLPKLLVSFERDKMLMQRKAIHGSLDKEKAANVSRHNRLLPTLLQVMQVA